MQPIVRSFPAALLFVVAPLGSAAAQAPNPDSPDLDFASPFLQHEHEPFAGVYSHDLIHTPDGRLVVAFVERYDASNNGGVSYSLPVDELVVVMRESPTSPWVELMRGHYNHDAIADVSLAVPERDYNDPKRDQVFVAVTLEYYDQLPDGKLDPKRRQRAVAVLRGSYKAKNPKSNWFQIAIPEQPLAYVDTKTTSPRPRVTTVAADPQQNTYFVDLVFVEAATASEKGGILRFSRSTNFGMSFSKPVALTGAKRVTWMGEPKGSKLGSELHRHPAIDGSWANRYTAIAFQNATNDAIEITRVTTDIVGNAVFEWEDRIEAGGAPLREPALAVSDEGAALVARGSTDWGDGSFQLVWYRGGATKGKWASNVQFGGKQMLERAWSAPDIDVRGEWMRVTCIGRPDGAGGVRRVMALEGKWKPSTGTILTVHPVDDNATGKGAGGDPRADLNPIGAQAHLGAAYSFTLQGSSNEGENEGHRYVRLDD